LITAIEKLTNRYEDVEKQLSHKYSITEASKLEDRINQIEQRLAIHENAVGPKLVELEDKITTNPVPLAAKENGIPDEDLIKVVVQEEITKNHLKSEILKTESETSLFTVFRKKKPKMYLREKTSDAVFVKDLLDGIFDTKLEDGDVEKMYRLGHWEQGKARPLLVAFRKLEQKEHIMANLNNLKQPLDRFKGISI